MSEIRVAIPLTESDLMRNYESLIRTIGFLKDLIAESKRSGDDSRATALERDVYSYSVLRDRFGTALRRCGEPQAAALPTFTDADLVLIARALLFLGNDMDRRATEAHANGNTAVNDQLIREMQKIRDVMELLGRWGGE
jgi:hypothetical protein